jgi:V-type H+-transporting ATPase subunit a
MQKSVFIIFYKSTAIEAKVKKISDAFSAKRYPVPDMEDEQAATSIMNSNYGELHDSRRVLLKNRDARLQLCTEVSRGLESWSWSVLREKSVYHTLNMFKPDVRGILRGEGWVISSELERAQQAVRRAHASMDMGMPSHVEVLPKPWPTPPTYFVVNGFTYPFQEFVNTYGVPRYKEANPALFTAATFPFLYGVMYGDMGHGSVILMLGCFLVFSYGKLAAGKRGLDEMVSGMFSARWMLLLMGFFSVYCGLIYNDFFALPINFFGSSWFWPEGAESAEGTPATPILPYGDPDGVYPFGLDPAWHIAENELLFVNSMKVCEMRLFVPPSFISLCEGQLCTNLPYFTPPPFLPSDENVRHLGHLSDDAGHPTEGRQCHILWREIGLFL